MGDARFASVALLVRQVRVHAVQQQLEALGGVPEAAQGEAPTREGAAGQGTAQWLRA